MKIKTIMNPHVFLSIPVMLITAVFRKTRVLGPIAVYIGLKISADALFSIFPHEGSRRFRELAPETTTPEFRSPFVELMLRAEQYFGERILSAKKSEIVDWLNEEGSKALGSYWSTSKSESMATFLRNPNQQKGGNKKIVPPD